LGHPKDAVDSPPAPVDHSHKAETTEGREGLVVEKGIFASVLGQIEDQQGFNRARSKPNKPVLARSGKIEP
jgi:hypothetical protein